MISYDFNDPFKFIKISSAIAVIISFYGFGTFGFFNIFGLALPIQVALVAFSFITIFVFTSLKLLSEANKPTFLFISFLFIYYGFFLSLSYGSIIGGLVNAYMMWVMTIFILFIEKKYIFFIGKSIIILSTISAFFGFIVFYIYSFNPVSFNYDSIELMSSDTGTNAIEPASFYDYLSFSSGDGYELFGQRLTRVKGYSNEPSTTLIHYLAPAAMGFFYGRKYIFMSTILIGFIVLPVSTVLGILTILMMPVIYLVMKIKKNSLKNIVVSSGLIAIFTLMSSLDTVLSSIATYGQDLYASAGTDLLSRKAGSAESRLVSYNDAVNSILSNPIGGSGQSSTAGIFIQAGLIGGLVLMTAIIVIGLTIYKNSIMAFNNSNFFNTRIFISMLLSLFLTSFVLSAYGWDRVSGVIILAILFRHLIELNQTFGSNKSVKFKHI